VGSGTGAGADLGGTRRRDLRLITVAIVVSALGSWSYNVAIAVYAYQQTHSAGWVALATVGRYLPALVLTWLGSRWVDRWPRRRVAVAADAVCAVAMAVLAVLAAAQGPLVVAIALASVSSAAARLGSAAAMAVAADVVAESQLVRSAAMVSTVEAVATAVGPALASLVLAVASPQVLFALNGLTFAASAVLLLQLGPVAVRGAAAGPRPSVPAARDRLVARSVRPLLAARGLAAGVYGADVVLLAVVATQQLRQGTAGYGWLLAGAGAGGLIAAAVLRRGVGGVGAGGAAAVGSLLGMALYSLPLLLLAWGPAMPASLAVQAVRGAGCVLVTTTVIAGLQQAVPSRLAAPMFARAHAVVLAGTSAGAVAAPILLRSVGLHSTLVVAALVPFAAQAALTPALRRFDRSAAAMQAAADPRLEVLRGLSLFRDASRRTLNEVADGAVEIEVATGVAVVAQGEPSDALYVLVAGSVEVTVGDRGGRRVLRTLVAPAYFGEIGLIHSVPRTATVTTVQPCRVWRIPADAFLSAAAQAGLSSALSDSVRIRFSSAGSFDGEAVPVEI